MSGEQRPGYRAIKDAVAWRDLSDRSKIHASGPDAVSFLHAMLSNDVAGLPVGKGTYSAFLTATGKVLADFYAYRLSDRVLIDLAGPLTESFLETLGSFIIMDDVTLSEILPKPDHLAIYGPKASRLLACLGIEKLPEEHLELKSLAYEEGPILCLKKADLSRFGWELILPPALSGTIRGRLLEAGRELGLEQLTEAAFDVIRTERGMPLFGHDFSEKNNPIEAGLDSAFSLAKGCYPGQEVLSKATRIGGVARRLCRLRFDEKGVPDVRAPVLDEAESEIGWVTSAVYSPDFGHTIGFAYLKRACAQPGIRCSVLMDSSRVALAEVVEEFSG
jgi:aminomethyltransferase